MSDCSHPCGGGCCLQFTFGAKADRFAELLEITLPERIASGTAHQYDRDAVWWLPHVHLNAEQFSDGVERFHCDLHDATTGKCTVYETRPQTCRDFPGKELAGACMICGFAHPDAARFSEELAQLTKAPAVA